mgnify:FL=1
MSDDPDDERGDPFADLDDTVGDREGDPFERLGEGPADPDESGPADSGDSVSEGPEESAAADRGPTGPADATGGHGEASGETGPPEALDAERSRTGDVGGPLSGRIEDSEPGVPSFSEGEGREGDPFDRFDDAFDREEIDRIDPDSVWEALESAQAGGTVTENRQRTYAEVSKHSYCEQCAYFSAPPDIQCGHEGTQIVEFRDMETVRVVDCPVVEERKELREGGHGKD